MTDEVGISGFAVYVPPYRVDLESWCRWTNNVWEKTRAVVGHSFRMRGPAQSVYTMAATAVMRLIDRYDIDPARVGFLGLGTESSTDNSAGAVIVKGMLDEGLQARRRGPFGGLRSRGKRGEDEQRAENERQAAIEQAHVPPKWTSRGSVLLREVCCAPPSAPAVMSRFDAQRKR